jgi:hypothetical protein
VTLSYLLVMSQDEDSFVIGFVCMIPNVILSTILGYFESFGYQLEGCSPNATGWMRVGIIQYMIITFSIAYLDCLPRKYTAYFDRFMNQGYVSFGLAFVFITTQVITPWITLTLYLRMANTCSKGVQGFHAVLYWLIFSLQVIIFILSLIFLWIMTAQCKKKSKSILKRTRITNEYTILANRIIHDKNPSQQLYERLLNCLLDLSKTQGLHTLDILIFKKQYCRKLDPQSIGILEFHRRVCFVCKLRFERNDPVMILNDCGHILHWICFVTCIIMANKCPECKRMGIYAELRNGLQTVFQSAISTTILLSIPPAVQPSSLTLTKPSEAYRHLNAAPRPIVTIEYFNYTLQALPEQIPEQFQIAVAEA